MMTCPTEWEVIKVMFQTINQQLYQEILCQNSPESPVFPRRQDLELSSRLTGVGLIEARPG